MKSLVPRIAAAMIACCLSVPGFCQSTTIQDAAKNPAVHKALLQKIDRDQKEIQAYKVGHVVVGRIQLEGTDDPEFIRSQMMIFEDGFFSDAVRDLMRPIAFRTLGYRPVDAAIPAGAVPDDSGAIDLGTIRMEKCAPSEFRKAVGTIRLEKPLEIRVEYIVAENPATTFDPDSVQETTFPAGTKWKSGPKNEWDLEFVQTAGTVTFNYFYGPCTLADLGEGKLADFVKTDFSRAKLDPRRVPFASAHVYLLNHQRSLKHVVLFRVEVQDSSADHKSTSESTDK